MRPKAPVMPASSSIVSRTSIGPCWISLEASTARQEAMPIPLSAPSVVPLAVTHSPSI
ncbi:Uncharacterised protein [Vibrio cholerae]|nr:Uncharacterised protein [Vibrio cholerae]